MSKFSHNILEKIHKKGIKPRPKFYFVLIHVVMWVFVIAAILLGSLAVAVIIRHFTLADWQIINRISGGFVSSCIMVLPYVWFGLMILILITSRWLFSRTKKGYRVCPLHILIGTIVFSLIGGAILYAAKLDVPVEQRLVENVPIYKEHFENRDKRFVSPERGVLVGRIIRIIPNVNLIVIDFKSNEWEVDIKEAFVYGGIPLKEKMRVGILGELISDQLFKAQRIRLWRYDQVCRKCPFHN